MYFYFEENQQELFFGLIWIRPHRSTFYLPREHSKCHRWKSDFPEHIVGRKLSALCHWVRWITRDTMYGTSRWVRDFSSASCEDAEQWISVLPALTAKRNMPPDGRAKTNNPHASVVKWSFFKEMHMHVNRVERLPANGRKVMQCFTSISGKTYHQIFMVASCLEEAGW